MRTTSSILLVAAILLVPWHASAAPVEDVDPFIGTDGHGHTFPGATVPFGFVQLSPDTADAGWDGCAGYHGSKLTLLGFSHTHLSGTGVGDLGDVLLMPVTGDLQAAGGEYQPLTEARFASAYSHDHETASPGYYAVDLDRYHVHAELTATAHVGVHRYTFPADQAGHVLLDLVHGIHAKALDGELSVASDHRLTGSRTTQGWSHGRPIYFVIDSARPWTTVALEAEGKPLAAGESHAKGTNLRAAIDFKPDAAPLVLRVGLSATSVEEAAKNLDAEVPAGVDFDSVRAAARKTWDEQLSRITIESPDRALRRTFYTATYHAMLAPTIYNDADGTYRGNDGKARAGEGFTNYSTFSLWDTYRAEQPLLTLVEPERVDDFACSLLAFYQQSATHELPIWPLAGWETRCMIGYHAVPVLLDAYRKGFKGFDARLALKAMQDAATSDKNTPADYEQRGYVPADGPGEHQATSRTLEYSFDDWCIARMAEALGERDVAARFDKRALFYKNVFDPAADFFRGKLADGSWRGPFEPKAVNFADFTEANAWQYAFAVQQDVPAMIALYGGREKFIAKLDACFDQEVDLRHPLVDVTGLIGQYSHGNEPCHHVPYLYALAGAQDRTAQRVREIMRLEYDDTPEGLCGNDDCGQMSAWYVFSAIGLYPVNPADGRYVIGSPIVRKATLTLDPKFATGKTFMILAPSTSSQNVYIQSAKLNGTPLDRPWVTHAEILAGGTLELDMGMLPMHLWSNDQATRIHVAVDATTTPDLKAFADAVQKTADVWYPRLAALMRPNDVTVTRDVTIDFLNDDHGIAETSGDRIRFHAGWFRKHPDDVGVAVHELTHVVQAYQPGAPGWFTEGFADYVRWFLYEPADKRPAVDASTATYHDGYRTSAAFLDWVGRTHGQDVLLKIDADCRNGTYADAKWQAYAGQSLADLGDAWRTSLAATTQPAR